MKASTSILFLLMVLTKGYVFCQSLADLKFTHITPDNGLSTQHVRRIFQDSRGLLWFCTTSGLNRYDGNSFKIYKQIPGQANSLPGDDIWDIKEDRKGNFWVGTQSGLCYFEPAKNKFTNYIYNVKNTTGLAYSRAENVLVDEDDNLWVGSLNGLQKFDSATRQFKLVQFATKEELAIVADAQHVYALYQDRKKQLWVQAGGSLFLVNKKNLSIKKIISTAVSNLGINSIYQAEDMSYWLFYWGKGIAKFDGTHLPTEKDFVTSSGIYFMGVEWTDMNHEQWLVALKQNGISFFNRKTDQSFFIEMDITKPNGFGAHNGSHIIADNNNNLWVATKKGVELLEPAKQFFRYHYLGEKKDREDYLNYGMPTPILKDGSHYWIGLWHGKGMQQLDSNWKMLQHFESIPASSASPLAKTIYHIHKSSNDIFWISTDEGLVRFNKNTHDFKLFVPSDITLYAFAFNKILPLGQHRLLIKTAHHGLYVFNTLHQRFEHHLTEEKGLMSNDVTDMAYDKKGILWLTEANGFYAIDTASLKVTVRFAAGTHHLPDSRCRSVQADYNNNLWIATDAGICRYNQQQNSIATFTTADGLGSNYARQVLVDNHNNIWVNTANGVAVYIQKEKRFQVFFKADGLPQNSLDGPMHMHEDGTIYLINAGLIISINPGNIPFNKNVPKVFITDVMVKNAHYNIQLNNNGDKYLETDYANNSFTVQFTVLNFSSSGRNSFYYKLQGIESEWQQSSTGIASYHSLPPGKYVLRVKGANNNGVMNETGESIIVVIRPEWYQTWWLKFAVTLLAGALMFYVVKRRIASIRKEALLKQQVAEKQMEALRAQMNPHFIFNSLNSIENFIMQNEKRLASDYLNKFSRLMRSILDSSQNEWIPLYKELEALQWYVELQQLRLNNQFGFKVHIDEDLLRGDYKVPSMLIQPFAENAIEHGFAHSDRKDLVLNITVYLHNDHMMYTIEDNGIGRKQSAAYNRQNKPYHKGVGLAITTDRVNMLNKDGENSVQITDIYDAENNAAGTRVQVKIKM